MVLIVTIFDRILLLQDVTNVYETNSQLKPCHRWGISIWIVLFTTSLVYLNLHARFDYIMYLSDNHYCSKVYILDFLATSELWNLFLRKTQVTFASFVWYLNSYWLLVESFTKQLLFQMIAYIYMTWIVW
jgi:hypothetical protein